MRGGSARSSAAERLVPSGDWGGRRLATTAVEHGVSLHQLFAAQLQLRLARVIVSLLTRLWSARTPACAELGFDSRFLVLSHTFQFGHRKLCLSSTTLKHLSFLAQALTMFHSRFLVAAQFLLNEF